MHRLPQWLLLYRQNKRGRMRLRERRLKLCESGAPKRGAALIVNQAKKFFQNVKIVLDILGIMTYNSSHCRALADCFKKFLKEIKKTSWQMTKPVVICQSSLRRAAVPCKLNNAKTKWTPWTINGLFKKSSCTNEWKTANENSWVINASSKLFKTLILELRL